MKKRLNPTEISLKDLPLEGKAFEFTRESGELTTALEDLIGNNDYSIQFTIKPMGNTFDLRGYIRTALDVQCSLCTIEFKHKVDQKIHDFILLERPLGKGEKLTKSNHAHEWEEDGPDYIVLDSDMFRIGDYMHEMIALAEPIKPLGKPDCELNSNCENMRDRVERSWLIIGDPLQEDPVRSNPFQVLEKFKLKS